MRLIDADKFKGKAICNHTYGGVLKIINIDDIPTAYDIDKVVEELEKAKTISIDIGFGTIINTIRKDVVLEIVKQGSVSDDVCEWEQNGYNLMTQCGNYFNEYDNCIGKFKYCPCCGKKIKVVE